jgi:hypothetical protein
MHEKTLERRKLLRDVLRPLQLFAVALFWSVVIILLPGSSFTASPGPSVNIFFQLDYAINIVLNIATLKGREGQKCQKVRLVSLGRLFLWVRDKLSLVTCQAEIQSFHVRLRF